VGIRNLWVRTSVLAACAAVTVLGSAKAEPECTAFTGVTVINPPADVTYRATVIACGERIEFVGAADPARVSHETRIIDARDAFLIPGLWDMHVHLDQAGESAGPRLVSYGVTSVRDVGSPFSALSRSNERLASDALVGPRIYAAGVMFESPRFMDLVDHLGRTLPAAEAKLLTDLMHRRTAVSSIADIEREVEAAKGRGAVFAKVRNVQRPELLYAFATTARRVGLPLAAHVLSGVDLAKASANGVRSFEHYQGYVDVDAAPPLTERSRAAVAAFTRNRTALVPTLVTRESQRLSPDAAMEIVNDASRIAAMRSAGVSNDLLALWRMKIDLARMDPPRDWLHAWNVGINFARFAHESGVDILAGTDLGAPFVYPGQSLIEELELLVQEVGLTPGAALQSATVKSARWFDLDGTIGTIAAGELADMVLLRSNPLIDIRNVREVLGVMIRGTYYSRSDLRQKTVQRKD
jgi:imidazolonepropionase-like amidohydrolase